VLDHPYGAGASENVPHNRSYTAALAAAAMRGVRGAGHEVDLIDLIEDGFNPVMTKDDLAGWRLNSVVDPVAAGYQRRLMEADHLVFAFPVWWESMPAGTKGFLDKVLTKGIVYSEPDKPGLFINGIKNIKSVSLITVMSTPSFVYRWILGNPLLRSCSAGRSARSVSKSCAGSAPSTPRARRSRRVSASSKRPRRSSRSCSHSLRGASVLGSGTSISGSSQRWRRLCGLLLTRQGRQHGEVAHRLQARALARYPAGCRP